MTLAALVDAGVDAGALAAGIASLGLPVALRFETVKRGGFRATRAIVEAPHEHVHRHLHHIEEIIERSSLSARQQDLAARIFRKLGDAEAKAHGIPVEKVHFHEVGALDSIVDILGAAIAIDLLGVERIEASAIPPGRGSVRAAHGLMPLPAPATAELLRGVPLAESTADMEQTTPTGAAIIATIADSFGPLPSMTVDSIGLGAGSKEAPGISNVLRVFVGRSSPEPSGDRVTVLETNLDDLPGEVVGYATTQLLAAGALDAYVTPILMKKNRPGVMISVLCDDARVAAMEEILFRETTTLGVRRYSVSRHKLNRKAAAVETTYGRVQGKLGWLDGRPAQFSPEYDDCSRIATELGVPLREIYKAAQQAYVAAAPSRPQLDASPAPHSHTPPADHHHHDHDHDHGHGGHHHH